MVWIKVTGFDVDKKLLTNFSLQNNFHFISIFGFKFKSSFADVNTTVVQI